MRKLLGLVAALGLFVGATAPANAVVLPLTGATLSVQIATLPAIPIPWNLSGSADVTGGNVTSLSAGIFSVGNFTVPVTDPTAFPITGVYIPSASNGTGNFLGVDTTAGGGLMAVTGSANVCLFAPCAAPAANLVVPFTTGGVNGIGLGGAPITVTFYVNLTLTGNGWTPGTVSIGTFSQSGVPLQTCGTEQCVTLVTPSLISTNIGASAVIPAFARMHLDFAPEPGTALLLSAGVAGLGLMGRKRISK